MIWCHGVWWTLVQHRLICLVSRSSCQCCQTREWALCFKRVLSLRHDMIAEVAEYSAGPLNPVWSSSPTFVDSHGKPLSFHPCSNHANTLCLTPDYCIHPGPWNPIPLLHDAFHAKASVFNSNFVDDVTSTPVATEPDFTKDRFYNYFFRMLGSSMTTSLGGCIWTSFRPAVTSPDDFFSLPKFTFSLHQFRV